MSRPLLVRVLKTLAWIGVFGGLLMPLVFIKEVIFPFVFSKLIVFQVLIGLTFPAYALFAWMEPAYRPKKHPLLLAILAYFLAMGLSVVFSIDPLRSWWGNQERMNGYFTLLHFLGWLVMVVGMLRTWKDWELFLRAQVFIGGVVALTAIWQRWVNSELFFYKAGDRVGGVLDNPIYMGMYQMFTFFLLALLAFKTRIRGWWLAYGALGLMAVSAFGASQSRGPLVGLFLGLFAFAVFFGITSKQRRNRIASVSLVVTAIISYGALYLARGTELVKRLQLDRFVDFSSSTSTRLIAWRIAWEAFLENPLRTVFGWGFDTFHIIFNTHYNPISLRYSLYETWFDRAHNTVLDVLSMTGALGLLTYLGIFVVLFWSVYRAYTRGWIDHVFASFLVALPVAYFVQNLFVFDHPAGFVLSYLMFGLAIAATSPGFLASSIPHDQEAKTRALPAWVLVPVFLGAGLLVWRASILPFRASYLTIKASQLFPQATALEAIKESMKIWTPYRDEQVFLLTRALVGVGSSLTKVPQWEEWIAIAKAAGKEETDRHPKNSYIRYVYARLLSDTAEFVPGQAAEAEEQFKQALVYSPKRQQLHEGLARLYISQGRMDDALAQIRQIQEVDPENGYGDWLLGLTYLFDLQREQDGARAVVSAIEKPYPYAPSNIREIVPIFHAYRILGRGAELDRWADRIKADDTGSGDGPYYQFAYQSRLAGRKDLEARFVEQVERLFPGAKQRYEQSVAEIEAPTPAPTR